jgi:hypothetical protein
MTPGIREFRQVLTDLVDGRILVDDFDASYSRLWKDRRDHDWAALEAEHPYPQYLLPERRAEWDSLRDELIRRGELLPAEIQKMLDHIWTDLDVLDRPNGITADELREDCRQAIAKLDELEGRAT